MKKLFKKMKTSVKVLKQEVEVLIIAYSDSRTPFLAKFIIGLTVAYLLSPIDLIPDFIPVLGIIDDLIIVPALISLSLKLIPAHVLSETRIKVVTNPVRFKKNSWLGLGLIILIWACVMFVIYRLFRS
jgi:uncharacterized membrane protein YkvA (DUF1232 family)